MKRKRILALFLAAVSCLSLAVSASAAGTTAHKATDFKDYDRTAWYAEAVSAAVDNGLLYGKSSTIIDPNGDMTRAEMAAIINRSFGCYAKADISKYKDVSKDKWYFEDVAMAVQMGTYKGRSNSIMAPDAPISRQEAIPASALHWYAAYHDADTHPHIHMMIWTDQETVLKRDAVVKLRSVMTNSIFQAELENLYIRKDAAYKDVTEAARAVMHELVDCMEAVSDPPASIQQKLLELALELCTTGGKKQYAYLKKPLKDMVDSIVDELEKLPEVAAYYSVWNGLRDTLEGYYKNRPRQHNLLSQQKEFRAIKNAIIQEAERLRQQMEQARTASEQKPSQEEEPSSEETSTGASANPTLASESASSATSYSVRLPSEYLLNSTVRLFHQMGQIFRDNAAPPSNPMGIRIDSKRRKKLMQKRLAMGHKQDDHEQNYGQTLQ